MRKFLASIGVATFIVFVPAHISFALSNYQYQPQSYQQQSYQQQSYQLYWCTSSGYGQSGYYSYSPCPQQYSYPTTYTYPAYSYPEYYYYPTYYYPEQYYNYNTNTNSNYNYNYNYNNNWDYDDWGYYWY